MNPYRKKYTSLLVAVLAIGLAVAGCATPDTPPLRNRSDRSRGTLRNFETIPT